MSLRTSRRTVIVATLAAVLAGSVAFAPTATASNVAWSVSVGGPGFVVSAGQPGYWNGYRGYGAGYGYGYRHYRPWYRPVAPIVYSPYYAYAAPRVYAAPRPVYVQPPVVDYYGYGR
jgi:hypothetical protein